MRKSYILEQPECLSDDEEDFRMGYKTALSTQNNPRALAPSESNMSLSMKQGEQLLKLMKDRGFDMNQTEISKLKPKQIDMSKSKNNKAGFFDGGHSATIPELLNALNKAYNNNDPQQASCILSYILQNKGLSAEDRNKFGLMKCNLLYNLAAFEDCCERATEIIQKPYNNIAYASLSNYLAKCKGQLNKVWEGLMDLQRAKALTMQFKFQKQREIELDRKNQDEEFIDSQLDSLIRDINHTQLEYNIKLSKEKIHLNFVNPIYQVFRNRKILQLSCGDYHVLFLTAGAFNDMQPEHGKWATEVFGMGENAAGQVLGKTFDKISFNQPILIYELSGKSIKGIYSTRQSSIAYDQVGNIYEWGAKANGKKDVELTTSIGHPIIKIQKGNKQYAALTKNDKFFVWGKIQYNETVIFNKDVPTETNVFDIQDFSCGNNTIICIDKSRTLWGFGSNQYNQLPQVALKFTKEFVKIRIDKIGQIRKIYSLFDASFFLTTDEQLYFCGRHSYNKQPVSSLKQAQFPQQTKIISISGNPGTYFVTNQNGQSFKWQVDNSVKFKIQKGIKTSQRIIECSKGIQYRLKTLPKPQASSIKLLSSQLKTYQPIQLEITLRDQYGLYGLELIQPLKFNIFLSKKKIKRQDLIEQSEKFIKLTSNKYVENISYVDEIIESNLLSAKIIEPSLQTNIRSNKKLEIVVQKSGNYYFYLLINSVLLDGTPFNFNIQQSERQEEYQKKMKQEKQKKRRQKQQLRIRQQQTKKALEEERLAELERKKQTQKRAEDTLKKHMKEQQQDRRREEQQRKRKSELMVGGGFDLNKLKKKIQSQEEKQIKQIREPKQSREGGLLPDINLRPSSRKKVVLKKMQAPMTIGQPMVTTTTKAMELKSSIGFVKRGESKNKK